MINLVTASASTLLQVSHLQPDLSLLLNDTFLANFIYHNYRQALEIIEINSPLLAELSIKLGVAEDDYENYLNNERDYLASLRSEPAEEQAQAEYMELLFELDTLK